MILFKILLLIGIFTTFSMAQKEALIVAISDYRGIKDDFGRGIDIDVDNIKNLLTKWGFHITIIRNKEALKIDEYLSHYYSLIPNDEFVFYYSGHGSYMQDDNGDEKDGVDEIIVLSDGESNYSYKDDDLYRHFNTIDAKKLIIFDSCHSGTAYRGDINNKIQIKSIPSKSITKRVKSKKLINKSTEGGDYIVLSATRDNEQALTIIGGGSLFTTALVKELDNKPKDIINIIQNIGNNIAKKCNIYNRPIYHPQIHTSQNNKFKYISINKFLNQKGEKNESKK